MNGRELFCRAFEGPEALGMPTPGLRDEEPVLADANDPSSELLPWMTIRLGRTKALMAQTINAIVKKRAGLAGIEAGRISAHGLRSGYLTEAARQGASLPEAMAQSQHRSVQQAARNCDEAARRTGGAVRLW